MPQPGALATVDVPTPVAEPGEIRVRVACVGICGSDVEIFQGRREPKIRYSQPVLGHEVSGVVDQVGDHVAGIRVGDRVSCVEGWGALAEYVVTTPTNALIFDDRLDLADGCLLEVLPGTAMAAWCTGIERNSDVLVVGQGLSGLIITQLVAIGGCRRLVTVEPRAENCALSAEFGAHDVRQSDIGAVTRALRTDYPSGFDVAVIATRVNVIDDVVPLMRSRSRIVAYGGLDNHAQVDIMALHRRSISVLKEGEAINGVRQARTLCRETLQLAYDGVLNLRRLRSHDFPLDRAAEALMLRSGPPERGIHVVIHTDGAGGETRP